MYTQNNKIAKYIKIKFNDQQKEIDALKNVKPYVVVLYDKRNYADIEHVVDFIGSTKFSDIISYTTLNEFRNIIKDVIIPKYINKEVALFAGMYTIEAQIASDLCRNYNNIHLMSGCSTYKDLINVLRAIHTDDIAANALMIFARIHEINKISIVCENSSYAKSFRDQILALLQAQNIDLIYNIIWNPTSPTVIELDSNSLLFCICDGVTFTNIINNYIAYNENAKKKTILLVGSDTVHLNYDSSQIPFNNKPKPKPKIYLMVHAPNDVTPTTKQLYNHIYDKRGYDKAISPYIIFVHDLLDRATFVNKFSDISSVTRPLTSAALTSTTYSTPTGSPIYGGYWFMQGCNKPDEKMMSNIRKDVAGFYPTLINSAYAEMTIGYFSWAGKLKWNIYTNPFEQSKIDDNVVERFVYQETENYNAGHDVINIARKDGKWLLSPYKVIYPLDFDSHIVEYK